MPAGYIYQRRRRWRWWWRVSWAAQWHDACEIYGAAGHWRKRRLKMALARAPAHQHMSIDSSGPRLGLRGEG
jgi:hypothetical protein